MGKNLSRREFLKIIGLGGAISAISPGSGLLSPDIDRQLGSELSQYTRTGRHGLVATTCAACSAGCGLLVRKVEGRAYQLEGNPDHPVNQGKICTRGQAYLNGFDDPHRLKGPLKRVSRRSASFDAIDWGEAVGVVADTLQNTDPGEVAFLMGPFPDHLFDLVRMIANVGGATARRSMSVLRYDVLGEFEGRVTLMDAAQKLFGVSKIPYFDLQHAEVTFSFGANFLETWLSPVAYTRQYDLMCQGHSGRRGYLVQFEPRMSPTAAAADEWIPIRPGTEAMLAKALANLVAEGKRGAPHRMFDGVKIAEVARQSGVCEADLHRLARIFSDARRKLAIPGGLALGSANGLAAAQAILALNVLADNLGQEGGLFFSPDFLINPDLGHRPSTIAEVNALVERMRHGEIKALFVHGADPAKDLPAKLGLVDALQSVPRIISFASFQNETGVQADYLLPDCTPPESWGYQKIAAGGDRLVVSALQPVVAPRFDTRATADVLLAAIQVIGGDLAAALPFRDELDYLRKSVPILIGQGGFYDDASVLAFWSSWQQYGGWWQKDPGLSRPEPLADFVRPIQVEPARYAGDAQEYPYWLLLYPDSNLGVGKETKQQWLKESPDFVYPTNWNTRVEINPVTARALKVRNNDLVKISSPAGAVEAVVFESAAIHPDVVAIPIGVEPDNLGYVPSDQSSSPLSLLELIQNDSGNLAFSGTRVEVTPVG
jgi:anaerobic selenocysteine-containing dehydrogenase